MSSGNFDPVVDGVILTGNNGNNVIFGTNRNDQIFGLAGNDRLFGLAGMDLLDGGSGSDRLFGGFDDDKLVGGSGGDRLFGGAGNDWLLGGIGSDLLSGGNGNDELRGDNGSDRLLDGPGDDLIDGGAGNDTLFIGRGNDTVVLAPGNGRDTIIDFQPGTDQFLLESGLTFDDLELLASGPRDTLIRIDKPGDPNDGERLALLRRVRPNELDEDDFIGSGPTNLPPSITSPATASVLENQTSAIDVQSTDDMDSEGSGLAYSLSGGADQSLFSIDANTGVVTFNAAPDFEAPGDANGDNDYEIQVTVTDSGSLSDVQDITISVTDEVENAAPTITSPATASVPENQTSAIDVQSTDDNDSEGSGLTYSLTGGADQSVFSIDANTGVITFDLAPDFELPGDANGDNDYEVQVTVTDSDNLSDVQDITISVTDEVENAAPTITSPATASVPENQTSAIDVQSTDDNDSEGSGLTYSLSGGADQSLFSIDSSTGVVTFNAAPDFEAPGDANGDNDYEIQVTVTDSATLSDVQDITISVTDEVENAAPTITSPATASVPENQTSAIDVQSTDDNDSEGSGLTYSLSGGADQSLFSIDSSTGVVTFNAAPDFEAPGDANGDNDYEIQVTVTDSATLSDVQDITISVTDEVENAAPTITSPATASVPENQTSAIDVQSTDDNDSEGSGLTYSLSGGADQSLFSIDSSTGVVTFNAAPDFEAPGDANGDNDYEIQVTVTDSATLSDVQDITISVTDEVENAAPTITSPATASVPENQTSAIDVQSTDDNDSEGSGLTYSLSGGADQSLFSIDSSTGVVTFNAAPDFEAPGDANGDNDYEIQVTVTDTGSLSDVQDITISVTDVADTNVDPVAVNQTYSTFGNTVLEVAGADIPGNEVTSVTSATNLLDGATDADGDTLSVQAGTFATTEGGSVTIFSDGSFYYTPEAGDASVADTFTFTVLDGNGGSDTATATINVGDRIWYVDDDAAAGGDGTSANPFNSLASLNGAGGAGDVDGAGDRIYVLDGTYSSGFELEANQTFEGQGVDLVVDGTTLISGSAANSPTLSGSISGTNVGTATISGLTASTLALTINSGVPQTLTFSTTRSMVRTLNGLLDLNASGSANVRIDCGG